MFAVGATALASWYGPGLYGNGLACGGTLRPSTNGVAHKTLACGTRLVVCYRKRCARTRVVDRGPYIAGRTFDLCAGLAKRLRFSGVDVVSWGFA
jgi:rare lipoprotein A (peptidoglycan hydrolase)